MTQRFPGKRELTRQLEQLRDDLSDGTLQMWEQAGAIVAREAKGVDQTSLYPPAGAVMFNMAEILADGSSKGCGTVGCIGGLLAYRMGLDADKFIDKAIDSDPRFSRLFYPVMRDDFALWSTIKPAVAAAAIDMFLNGRIPEYEE